MSRGEEKKKYYQKHKEKILAQGREYYEKTKEKTKFARLLSAAQSRAKKKALSFDITLNDVVIPLHCPVLGVDFIQGTNHGYSIDRIDNDRGYTKDNIQVISKLANVMKNSASVEELRSFARWVFNTYGDPEQELKDDS